MNDPHSPTLPPVIDGVHAHLETPHSEIATWGTDEFQGDDKRWHWFLGDLRRKYLGKKYPPLRRALALTGAAVAITLTGAVVKHKTDDWVTPLLTEPASCQKASDVLSPKVLKALIDVHGQILTVCTVPHSVMWDTHYIVQASGDISTLKGVDIQKKVAVIKE